VFLGTLLGVLGLVFIRLEKGNIYIIGLFITTMFGWLFNGKHKKLEEKTQKGFHSVKKDIEGVGKWIKHLDRQDKQLFDQLNELKWELSTVREEIVGLREGVGLVVDHDKNKQLSKKLPVWDEQTGVGAVQEAVQEAVQTGSFHGILKGFSANERLLLFTLINAGEGMKLSYEDLALLLGKERSTVRGQINAIKQKREGLIQEISEKNGKKRVFVPEEVRKKLVKYAKVRVKSSKKTVKPVKKARSR